jgi:hypothetical protein
MVRQLYITLQRGSPRSRGYTGTVAYLLEKGGSELVEIEDDKEHNTAIFCAVGKLCYESMKVKSGDKKASPANLAEAQACVVVLLKS